MAFLPVADGVLVRTSRRMRTTTTLILGRAAGRGLRPALLVDPAWEADELAAIADELDAREVEVVAGLATHAHHDHLLWHPRYGEAPRWASPATVAAARARRRALLAELTADAAYPADVLELFGGVVASPSDHVPDPAGVLPETVLVVHDAHAPGHTALWLPAAGVLVAGDMLSDVETPLPFDTSETAADLAAYGDGLDRLAPWVARARVVVPGHGTPSSVPGAWSPAERLDADRRYLDAVLAGRPVDDPRLADPGMLEEHERAVRVAARARGGSAEGGEHRSGRGGGQGDQHERGQALPERPHG
ncbi:MBL fold metallo-hydrolase [Isoptericola variabilis]|uniref:Zn-dependent hydrolase, including glyoxylase n=1 Tax=Isoptericola variabilis (strain 225) TaxID=743718 RepID=F6FTQ6_ISOV2|nr:MBL fold metallo-hydrolase [Isoptericola variabilis]AEG44183.1 Zn-dependent hydrolase, including glyoxylase [Isoptericola variabilis 225]TWH28502.1 glyoxylase-like metal-dependent hydrolase (beta-lactamase superfamily II) [Isoptericola variabilis J7]